MKSYEQIAYEAYCEKRDWQSFDGKRLPDWAHVHPGIKAAWKTAVDAVISTFKAEIELHLVESRG